MTRFSCGDKGFEIEDRGDCTAFSDLFTAGTRCSEGDIDISEVFLGIKSVEVSVWKMSTCLPSLPGLVRVRTGGVVRLVCAIDQKLKEEMVLNKLNHVPYISGAGSRDVT